MKKRLVFQEDRAPRSEGSATRKQLVLGRAAHKPSLPDLLLLAVPGPDSSAWRPKPVSLRPAQPVSARLPASRAAPLTAAPSLLLVQCVLFLTSGIASVFLLKRILVFITFCPE